MTVFNDSCGHRNINIINNTNDCLFGVAYCPEEPWESVLAASKNQRGRQASIPPSVALALKYTRNFRKCIKVKGREGGVGWDTVRVTPPVGIIKSHGPTQVGQSRSASFPPASAPLRQLEASGFWMGAHDLCSTGPHALLNLNPPPPRHLIISSSVFGTGTLKILKLIDIHAIEF